MKQPANSTEPMNPGDQGLLLLGLAPLTLPFILCGWLAQLARRLARPDRLRAR